MLQVYFLNQTFLLVCGMYRYTVQSYNSTVRLHVLEWRLHSNQKLLPDANSNHLDNSARSKLGSDRLGYSDQCWQHNSIVPTTPLLPTTPLSNSATISSHVGWEGSSSVLFTCLYGSHLFPFAPPLYCQEFWHGDSMWNVRWSCSERVSHKKQRFTSNGENE